MFLKKSLEERISRQKKIRQKGNRTKQKNKRGDSKVESNDSPEIPDRGETSDIPGLPSGAREKKKQLLRLNSASPSHSSRYFPTSVRLLQIFAEAS